jgi:hypothetical protein
VSSQRQVRFCACGTRLASDNPGVRCGACQRGRASDLGGAPVVPAEFWVSDRISAALASRHMGNVIYAFRTHPWHGGAISQSVVAGWAGVSQGLVSRVESGPQPVDAGARLADFSADHIAHKPRNTLSFCVAGSTNGPLVGQERTLRAVGT